MRLRLGCALGFELPQPTPMIAMLNVHYSQAPFLERPDVLVSSPAVPITHYRDGFGNWCTRFTAPAGAFQLKTDGVIHLDGALDAYAPDAVQHPVQDLPAEVLVYLLASRYCETDRLMEDAWRLFGHTPEGWARVEAICQFVHNHIRFDYMQARATRTAAEAYAEQVGVCRDYAHLAVAFCRCMNIPTRYCTGYISDIGEEPPYADMDFAAWMEVYLGGQWWTFDPRNLKPRRGRVLIAHGRDAADVPLTHSFGPNVLSGFEVWIAEEAA